MQNYYARHNVRHKACCSDYSSQHTIGDINQLEKQKDTIRFWTELYDYMLSEEKPQNQ